MPRSVLFRNVALALQKARRRYLIADNLPEPIRLEEGEWSRRQFIKKSIATASAVALLNPLMHSKVFAQPHNTPHKVVVIGAGIAGLNAAYTLKKSGVTAEVYEARSVVGGRIFSNTLINGLIVDYGGELINTDHHDMLNLAKTFNISLSNRKKDAASLPYSQELFFFNGFKISEKKLANDLCLIARQISQDSKFVNENREKNAPILDQYSVAHYLNLHSKLFEKTPYIRTLLEAALRSEFGVEPHESTALQLINILPEINGQAVDLLSYSDETYCVTGGSSQIPHAIASVLPGQIHLNKALVSLDYKDSQYQLKFSDNTETSADLLIITIPFSALRQVKLGTALNIDAAFIRFIHEANLGSNEKVIADFSQRFWRQPNGFSLSVWSDLGFTEVWDGSLHQPLRSDGVLNFFLGGDQARALRKIENTKTIGNQLIADLDRVVPGALASASGMITRSNWEGDPYIAGGYASFKPGQLTRYGKYFWVDGEPSERQQVNFHNLFFAGEHLSDAYYGFMEGGAQTGRFAASFALKRMRENSSLGLAQKTEHVNFGMKN